HPGRGCGPPAADAPAASDRGVHRTRLVLGQAPSQACMPAVPRPDLSPEVARLQAEVTRLLAAHDQLRAERADAIESAHAAWEVASDRPPRPARPADPCADRLLKAPRSGVRPLSGTWEDR